MRSELSRKLGIERAIFGFSHQREIVAEISRAGGMGVLGALRNVPEKFEEDINWLSENTDGKPFGIDIVFPNAVGGDPEELRAQIPQEHKDFVAALDRKFDVPPPSGEAHVGVYSAHRITREHAAQMVEIALRHKTPFLASALGVPPADVIEKVHGYGGLVGSLVGSTRHVARQIDAGVDVIVAQGTEAAGHTGTVSTLVLVPQVVDLVAGRAHVAAAGGIGDGRQVAAAEMLGAQGVWLGTAWLTTTESSTMPSVKRRLLEATSEDTRLTRAYTGKPSRLVSSPWLDAWEEPGAPEPLKTPLQGMLLRDSVVSIVEHDVRAAVLSPAGQVIGMLNDPVPVATIMQRLVDGYEKAVARVQENDDVR
jgi:NAD(P)H-dependent flavin oxidoreductase YrpB (nitropropane dioxygenase family)